MDVFIIIIVIIILAVLGLRCSAQASHCSGFSILQSMDPRACGLRRQTGSVVAVPGL